jgi:hypothetical protein
MKLTLKDKDFLERLKRLFDSKDLEIGLKKDGLKRLILRKNYGDRIEEAFGITRQGVRWRFQRLFNEIYPEAYDYVLKILMLRWRMCASILTGHTSHTTQHISTIILVAIEVVFYHFAKMALLAKVF